MIIEITNNASGRNHYVRIHQSYRNFHDDQRAFHLQCWQKSQGTFASSDPGAAIMFPFPIMFNASAGGPPPSVEYLVLLAAVVAVLQEAP